MVTSKVRGWRFGVFEADLELHELRKRGIHIRLAGQPFQALTILMQRTGAVVSREELRNALWPGEPWGDHDQGLNKAINKIREALKDSADTPRLIETIPRVGYRFLVPVTPLWEPERAAMQQDSDVQLESKPEAAPALLPVSPLTATLPVVNPPPRESGLPRSAIAVWLLASVLILAFAGLLIAWRSTHQEHSRQGPISLAAQAKPLTTFLGSEQYPAFAPNNTGIAFAWNGAAQKASHIFTITSSGGNLLQITRGLSNDYAPAWSPDSSKVAFVRESAEHWKELWQAAANGSHESKIADFGRTPHDDHPIAWTKDARWLVASLRAPGEGPSALYLISVESGERRRVTSPPIQSAGDLSPSVSADGRSIAFTRGTTVARRDIFLLSLTAELSPAGEPRRVTDLNRVIDTIAWNSQADQVYFTASSTPSGARHIFRVNAGANSGDGSVNHSLEETGIEGIHPVVSPDGGTLCYVRSNIEQSSIWRMNFQEKQGAPPQRERLLSSTRRDYTADLSPNGKQLLFSSVRSGASEIWISNVDGTNLKQITSNGASTPRWAPDGKRIAYESSISGQPDIYVRDLNTSKELRLTSDPASDLRPSWSHDGQRVYFSSSRSGRPQIWKVPSSGGKEAQITHEGGVYAVESLDGNSLFFTSADQSASIKSMPTAGGVERTLLENVVGHSALSLGPGGLYYLSSMSFNGGQIAFFDFSTKTSRPLLAIDHPIHHFLSSSAEGSSVLFTQVDQEDTDLMLLHLK